MVGLKSLLTTPSSIHCAVDVCKLLSL